MVLWLKRNNVTENAVNGSTNNTIDEKGLKLDDIESGASEYS